MTAGAATGVRVAFQGERGAYGDEAIAAYWRGRAEPVPARECAEVARLVDAGAVDYGLLPVENTLAGSVTAAYDALLADGVRVVGEVVLPIRHCLLAHPDAEPDGLVAVASHPVALAQCRAFLRRHPQLEARAVSDTAGAARAIAERGERHVGAIASRGAARRYGLAVLASGIQDRDDNQTRFVAIAAARGTEPTLPAGAPARTALVATLTDEPGALVKLLAPFAEAGLNVGAPVPRPTGEPWTYRFVMEVEHAAGDPRLAAAVEAVRRAGLAVHLLGTFARATPATWDGAPEGNDAAA